MKSFLNLEKINAYIGREIISKPENQAISLVFLLVFNIGVIGYFGVYRGYVSYKHKQTIKTEYENLLASLESNSELLEAISPYIKDSKGALAIDSAIPTDSDNSAFLSDITKVYSRNGFVLESMQISSKKRDSAQSSNIAATGFIKELPDLVQDIEGLDRLVKINSLTISPEISTNSQRVKFLLLFDVFNLSN